MRRLLIFLVIGTFVALLIRVVPGWLAEMGAEAPSITSVQPPEELEIDAFLEETLPAIGAQLLLARDERDGVVRSTWQLAYGVSESTVVIDLQRRAATQGIDIHPVEGESPDRIIRVFGRRDLVHELILVPAAPRVSSPGFIPDPAERPLVALVLTGLGADAADYLVDMPVPLTLAVRPFLPYSLMVAESSVHHWHEVLVDMGGGASKVEDPTSALAALPFASGIRVEDALAGTIPSIPMGVLLHPSTMPLPEEGTPLTRLMAQDAARLGLDTAKARALHLATTEGVGVLSVPHDHPQIDQVLKWSLDASDEGYRLVLVSEAIREHQFRGPETDLDDG